MRIWIAVLLACGACAKGSAPDQADATLPHPDAAEQDAAPDAAPDAPIDARPDAPPDAEVTLTSITVSAVTVAAGLTTPVTAIGHYSDGSTADVTAQVTSWDSSMPSVVTVDATGLATTHAMGTSTITASIAGGGSSTTGMFDLAVDAAAVTDITLSAAPSGALPKGATAQLVATGSFTDGTMADVSDRATWSTTDDTLVTVDDGLVKAVASSGSATISAAIGSVHGDAQVSDGPAQPASLAIVSGDVSLAQKQRARLHAALTYTDGTTQDVTASATWSTDAATVVSVASNVIDAKSTVSAAHITAKSTGFMSTITATVTAATCQPVINEVQPQGVSAGDEWVELYNPCTVAIDVGGWTLDYRAHNTVGTSDTNRLATLAGTMAVGELRLYVGPQYAGTATPDGAAWGGGNGLLAATSGAIGLRSGAKDTGTLVDAVGYGSDVLPANPFLEGTAAGDPADMQSIARARFDGDDTNRNATDFEIVGLPTPKALNNP